MREIVHIQIGQAGNNIGSKVNPPLTLPQFLTPHPLAVLGSNLRRARRRSHGKMAWRHRLAIGKNQRLLQRSQGRQVRPQVDHGGPGTEHHGHAPVLPLRAGLPPGQFRLRPRRSRKQLGQGPLHRRSGNCRLGAGPDQEGSGRMRLLAGRGSRACFRPKKGPRSAPTPNLKVLYGKCCYALETVSSFRPITFNFSLVCLFTSFNEIKTK